MKRSLTITLAALLLVAVTVPAIAWEFSMKGEWEYRMRYFSRTGGIDLFGYADLQNNGFGEVSSKRTGFVGFAGPRWYNRGALPAVPTSTSYELTAGGGKHGRITRGGFSRTESDAFWTDSRLTFYPEIRVNPAIRVHGVYNVGGYNNKYAQSADWNGQADGIQAVGVPPFSRYYMSQTSGNAYDTAAVGSWEQFRATIQVPWGTLSLGVKDFPFGVGSTLGNNTRAEAFLTVIPYGPFRFLHGIWLSRGVFDVQAGVAPYLPGGNAISIPPLLSSSAGGSNLPLAVGGTPIIPPAPLPAPAFPNLSMGQEGWSTSPDSQSRNTFFQGLLFTYDQGPLSIGGGALWRQLHVGRNEMNNLGLGWPGLAGTRFGNVGFDMNTLIYVAYMKYFNGRFFANMEWDTSTNDIYCLGAPPRFDEYYHWWCELGMVSGPAKVSLLWSIASGDVLNTGNITKNYRGWAINYQAMEPYQFLMFETYAGGNNGGWHLNDVTFVADDKGMMTDAFCYAGRVDYAVASNLNVFGSYLWAHRLETAGRFKGHYTSTGATATAAERAAFVTLNYGAAPGPGGINPYVDDGFIGWEANLGMAWKLLEGLTLNMRYSYWKPGQYFDQAFQNVGMAQGVAVNNALVTGKSPIMGMTGSLMIDF